MAGFKQGEPKNPPSGAGFGKNNPLTDTSSAERMDPRVQPIIDAFGHPDTRNRNLSLSVALDKANKAIDSGLEISSLSGFLVKTLTNTADKDAAFYAICIISHAEITGKDIGSCYALLIRTLQYPDHRISSGANEILENAAEKKPELVKHQKLLEGMLYGTESMVQRRAISLLKKIAEMQPKNAALMTAIAGVMRHPDPILRTTATRSVESALEAGLDINAVTPDIFCVRDQLEVALGNKDAGIRRMALGILRGAMERTPRNVSIMEAVSTSLSDPDPSLQSLATRVLIDIAEKGTDMSPILPALETAYLDKKVGTRRSALSILQSAYSRHLENASIIGIIALQLNSSISDAQMEATKFLDKAADAGADLSPIMQVLQAALESDDTRVRRNTLSILKTSHDKNPGDASTLILIAKGLQDPVHEIQTGTVRYLENKAKEGADLSGILGALESCFSNPENRVRRGALQILKQASETRLQDDRYLILIGKGLEDSDPDLQSFALRCMERAVNMDKDIGFCVVQLAALIDSPDGRVSRQALGVLSAAAEHGTDISVVLDNMISCLASPNDNKRNASVRALANLASKGINISKAVPELVRALENKERDPETRHGILKALCKAAEHDADISPYVQPIATALYEDVPDVRLASAQALLAISRFAKSETNRSIVKIFLEYSNSSLLAEEAEKNSVFYVEFIKVAAALVNLVDVMERVEAAK